MNVDMPTVCVQKSLRLHIKGRDACDFTDEINLSSCASAPFHTSQDRIHLGNVTFLQLLKLEEKIRIKFGLIQGKPRKKMYSLHDTQLNGGDICPFSGLPDAGGEFEREHPRPALTHSNTRSDAPLQSVWEAQI
jgi:hypothetical protein